MRTKYKYLKKKNKSNIINNIYPHNQMNYDGIQVEDEPDFQDEQEYIEALDYYIKNFEKIINNKRARKSKKKRNENNN